MVTIEYFYVYVLLLVLHFPVPLSADELIQNVSTPAAVKDTAQTANETSVPNLNVPPEFPKASTNCTKVISTKETLDSLNIQNVTAQTAVKDMPQASNATSVPNSNAPPEFPKATTNCTKVISTNETLANPNLNITLTKDKNTNPECDPIFDNTSTNTDNLTESSQKEINETTTSAKSSNDSSSSNANLDVPNLNKTENLTSTNQLSNVPVPPEFPQSSSDGTKVLPYNTSIASSALNTTDVKDTTGENGPNSTNKIDSEVPGLLDTPCNKTNISASVPEFSPSELQNLNNDQTELVEDGKDTEESLRQSTPTEKGSPNPGVPLVKGQLAAILAAVFVIISLITYIGLLTWRRFLENRYGNRELLVNEDEFNDRDDMRHFTI